MFIPAGYANIQTVLRHVTTGQEALTAIGVHLEAADPGTVLAGAAAAWDDAFSGDIGISWHGLVVRLVIGTADPEAPLTFETDEFVGGDNNSECAPPQVALLIRKLTMTGGRKGKGRMYIVGPGEAGIDDAGNFSGSQHEANQNNATQYAEALLDIEGVTGLYLFHNDPDDDPSEIVALSAQQMVGTQRRRLR